MTTSGLRGVRLDVAFTVSFWIETFIYGIYTSLFIAAISVMMKRRRSTPQGSTSAWVFLIATILMYAVATFHLVLGLYRFIRAFILVVEPLGAVMYLVEFKRWDTLCNSILTCLMTWIGDALVIYRCYFVWNNNIWLIAIPVLLLLSSIGVNIYVLIWFTHPFSFGLASETISLNTIYPLSFCQNVITTGLIALKIWKQHRASSASGVVDRSSRLSLIRVLRIITESAMIYTVQLFILIILYFRHDNFQYIVQAAIIPSIGIVFVVIALRVHNAKQQDAESRTNLGNSIPAWLADGDSVIELSQPGSASVVDVAYRGAEEKVDGDADAALAAPSYAGQKGRRLMDAGAQ
ncbi:hypothetical protein BDZ97DRAFT_1918234 [Flammula alnicola]|nr:hypothetical protein BDZ97DRAFT_1918234 [Flammula alnicola]